ncbi:hypothetical protein XENOCAPTIV_009063, partial [Xenoophorus captivus]
AFLQLTRRGVKLDRVRELGRQYPVFCFMLLVLLLSTILLNREQQDLLFRFMNFLKQEGAVHVLQFCLAVGECVLFTPRQPSAPPALLCLVSLVDATALSCENLSHGDSVMSDCPNFSEEFNDRILCPELSDSEKMMLHEEVKKIYETYCLDESVDKIRFDPFIVEEIRNSM